VPDENSFPASVIEYGDHFITVLPVAKFDESGTEPVLTSSYRAFIYRKKFESAGPPGMGRVPKKPSYDYPDWKNRPRRGRRVVFDRVWNSKRGVRSCQGTSLVVPRQGLIAMCKRDAGPAVANS
jgi:hypothetical protein